MLWPHYLRTIPSLSIVALTPTLPAMKMAETVPAGFEISSRPLGPKNTVCRYRTTRDLTLNPLAIEGGDDDGGAGRAFGPATTIRL